MKFMKSLNNNIAMAVDDNGNEVIVVGTGIGFKKVKGQNIDERGIQKIFKFGKNDKYSRLDQFFNEIPLKIVDVTDQIIKQGNSLLGKTLNDSILLTLSDHLNFAVERTRSGIEINNPLQWEIRHLYPKEYQIGQHALSIIKDELGIQLPGSEASFIALHFVNAQFDNGEMNETLQITKMISTILEIVKSHFHLELDDESLNYSRFITHLRYFIVRQINKESIVIKEENFLYDILSQRYPRSFECVQKINQFLGDNYGWNVTNDEMVYLMLHIERVTARADEN